MTVSRTDMPFEAALVSVAPSFVMVFGVQIACSLDSLSLVKHDPRLHRLLVFPFVLIYSFSISY